MATITRADALNRKLADMLSLLSVNAASGSPCPTNYELSDQLDLSSPGHAAELLGRLEQRGSVSVTRFSWGRIVTIVATGLSTDASKRAYRGPYSRFAASREANGESVIGHFRGEPPAHLYVDRDPCPRCGIRRDIGCRHISAQQVAA